MDLDSGAFEHLGNLGGAIGAVATVVFLTIRVYRLPEMQAICPERYRWLSLGPWVKRGIVVSLAALGSVLAGIADSLTPVQILLSIIGSVVASMSTHQITDTDAARAVAEIVVPPKDHDLQVKVAVEDAEDQKASIT